LPGQEIPFSQQDLAKASPLVQNQQVKEVFFSEGTYQVEVLDAKATFWPFLQFNDHGKLLDYFCICSKAEKTRSCPHLAAAYLKIFNGHLEPLHVRFRDSLWNQLCQIAAKRHGYEPSSLQKKEDYFATSVTGKKLFSIKALSVKGKKKLEDILWNRAKETEETSLKFSNLSSEELALWKEGRPSHFLRFELSFWSDLAKWWMSLQENQVPYTLSFLSKEKDTLPKWISICFKDMIEASFYIAEVNWQRIIPSLTTVDSPLPVYEFFHRSIESIVYDAGQKAFIIDFKEGAVAKEAKIEAQDESKMIPLGDWIYIPSKGFFPARKDQFFEKRLIAKEHIPQFLSRHQKIVQKHLQNTSLHLGSVAVKYHLFFDALKQLHICAYLFEIGDLQTKDAAFFGHWAYVENKGFYFLDNLLFEGVEKIIPPTRLSDFINRHRNWLNQFEGFQIHLTSLEAKLKFRLDEQGIHFSAQLEIAEESSEMIEFDEWIFIPGRGFYSKGGQRNGFLLKPGANVPPHEISAFIHAHKEELEQVKGFFSPLFPLQKAGINVSLTEQSRIHIKPQYFFKPSYASRQVHMFGDFAYVDGEGFSEIPLEMRLPPHFQSEKILSPAEEASFVNFDCETLKPFILTLDPRLKKVEKLFLHLHQIKKEEKEQRGQWIAQFSYESEEGHVPLYEIWQAQQAKRPYLFSSAGLIVLKQPRFQWLSSISKKRWLKKGRYVRLSTLEWIRLAIFEEVLEPIGDSKIDRESRLWLQELKDFQTSEPIDLSGLQSSLRPYQETGVKWLWFLFCRGLSGLLCDEMGLGKTHQAMALLAAAANIEKESPAKYLVVCPTSVIYHWEALLKRFLPNMRVYVFYGIQRTLEDFEKESDLLLTSYGTLRSEKKFLANMHFEIAIFDEVQIAKNAHSQTHKALRLIEANMKLGLTGTPIENRLLELKSLFDLVLPSYLPHDHIFREFFINPIEKYQDQEKKHLLSKLIKPFILRRKKSEVLLELPEKIEEIAYCDLSDEQRELYRTVFLSHKEALYKELKDTSHPPPTVHIFSMITKLKQICDHPCLFLKQYDLFQKHASGKWDLFVELLQEVRESGLKLVIFSQYLEMLDMIEAYLTEKGIGYAGIRGSTRNRKEQLDRFREDPRCEVFVASLQAAGVGVDLVAASVVIHYDRWWNPAKENQATDRVHRIGQSRGVQVFKMVCKNTIEEHIHRLIEKKLGLMEGIIGFDEHDQIKGLNREELLELLERVNQDLERV